MLTGPSLEDLLSLDGRPLADLSPEETDLLLASLKAGNPYSISILSNQDTGDGSVGVVSVGLKLRAAWQEKAKKSLRPVAQSKLVRLLIWTILFAAGFSLAIMGSQHAKQNKKSVEPVEESRPYGKDTMFRVAVSEEGYILSTMPDRDLIMLSKESAAGRRTYQIWRTPDAPPGILRAIQAEGGEGWAKNLQVDKPKTLFDTHIFPKMEIDCMVGPFSLACWDWAESPFAEERKATLPPSP